MFYTFALCMIVGMIAWDAVLGFDNVTTESALNYNASKITRFYIRYNFMGSNEDVPA